MFIAPERMKLALSRLYRAAIATICLSVIGCSNVVRSQDNPSLLRKFDEFENLRSRDAKAHLDLFAKELDLNPRLKGFIVGYRTEHWAPGPFLRELHGYREYLVNSMGQLPEKITAIDGGIAERPLTQLWLGPSEAGRPPISPPSSFSARHPLLFDTYISGFSCVGEYTLELQEPEDSVRFFAQALQTHPEMRGFVVLHPATRAPRREALNLAASSNQSLTRQHALPAERIVTRISAPRVCLEMNFWLVPSSLAIPEAIDPEVFFQSLDIAEAERERYTVRRVEFSGNQWTRDKVLRRRIPGLQEGEIFSKAILTKNLESLSRLKVIKRVTLADLDVHLNRREQMIDLTINITESRRLNSKRFRMANPEYKQ